VQAKCDNDLDQWIQFFAIIEIFLMRYYGSSLAIIFCDFRFFDNYLRLEKLVHTSYTEFLINTKLQNKKSNKEIFLNCILFFVFKIKTVNFSLKLAVYNSIFL